MTYDAASSSWSSAASYGMYLGVHLGCGMDSLGQFLISHGSWGTPSSYLGVATYDGSSVTNETLDNTGSTSNESTALAVDSTDVAHVAYYESTNDDLKYASNSTGYWVMETVDSGSGTSVGEQPAIAVDSSNKVHIVYYDVDGQDLEYATNSSGSWVLTTIDSAGEVGRYPGIAIDSDGKAHISYLSRNSVYYDLKYATNATGSWVTSTIDTSDTAAYQTSIVTTSPTSVHIAYHDISSNNLKYATNVTGSWVTSTVDTGGASSSIATNASGDIAIAYVGSGVELAYNTCGDGTVDASEECDDGNETDRDGCTSTCEIEQLCGDGTVDSSMGETCDDADADDTDSCPSSATDSTKTYCRTAFCGDGFVWSTDGGSEECDGGESPPVDGDGCSVTCRTEHPPVANAGPDQTVTWPIGYSYAPNVLVDGSMSTDPDLDRIYFKWTFSSVPAGSALTDANIVDANKARATFRPDVRGAYTLLLTVTDQDGYTATDTVIIRVRR